MAHLGIAPGGEEGGEAFWTACPHCCYVHSYERTYLGRRLRCPTPACRRAFAATELAAPPPVVPGADMYFCTWGFFPLGPPVVADGWVPFTPFHPFDAPPSPSPAPNAATAATTPVHTGSTSRKKVGVCLKGRARAEAEEEEEEEEEAAAVNAEAGADGVEEKGGSGIDINDTVDLSELGLRVDEMGVIHESP